MKKRFINILMFVQIIFCATMLTSCDDSAEWLAKAEKAIGVGDFTEARFCAANMAHPYGTYQKIARAQIAFLLNSGSVDQAYSIAQEDNCAVVFTELFMPKLSEIYESQGKAKALQYLTKVEFEKAPDLSTSSVLSFNDNGEYNVEATKYNSLLEQFISYVDVLGDSDFAIQLLKFIKPIVVEVKNGKVKLSDQPQEDIKKKLNL